MNTNDDFKSLWNQQVLSAIPDVNEIFRKANSLKKKTRNKLLLTNFLLACTTAYIIYIVFAFHPQMLTTKLGVVLAILAMVSYLIVANRMMTSLFKSNIE